MPTPQSLLKYTAATLISGVLLLYLADWALVRLRALHRTATMPYESMTLPRVLAIPEKGGKTEYRIDQLNPEPTITCVHSLFPHSDRKPCWYVLRKASRPIPMTLLVAMPR